MGWLDRIRNRLGGRQPGSDLEALSCAQVAELLHEYIDEELDPTTRQRVRQHLDSHPCPCQRALLLELAFLRRVHEAACREAAPPELRERILKSLDREGRGSH